MGPELNAACFDSGRLAQGSCVCSTFTAPEEGHSLGQASACSAASCTRLRSKASSPCSRLCFRSWASGAQEMDY